MILITFVKTRKHFQECRHLDGNKQNNHISNLKWGTHKENMKDRVTHGNFTPINGSQIKLSKLNEIQVIKIKKLLGSISKHKHNKKYPLKEIAKQYNVSIATISAIKNNKTWKHLET